MPPRATTTLMLTSPETRTGAGRSRAWSRSAWRPDGGGDDEGKSAPVHGSRRRARPGLHAGHGRHAIRAPVSQSQPRWTTTSRAASTWRRADPRRSRGGRAGVRVAGRSPQRLRLRDPALALPVRLLPGRGRPPGWLDSNPTLTDAQTDADRRRAGRPVRHPADWADGHSTGYYTFERLREECPCTEDGAPAPVAAPRRPAAPARADGQSPTAAAHPAGPDLARALLASGP